MSNYPGDLFSDIELLKSLADVSDQITMDRYLASDLKIDTKPDQTPVTDADRAVETKIRELLTLERPNDLVVGEEFGAPSEIPSSTRYWVIDPIDGTTLTAKGANNAISVIALASRGSMLNLSDAFYMLKLAVGPEAASVIDLLAKFDLRRGDQGLKVIMMCELPSNAVLADEFLKYFDGFSIGSNDMTQLTLGLDRDSGDVAHLFDERNAAVKIMLKMAIDAATKAGKYVGICGQGPSDHEDLAEWLMEQGISSVSLNPDTVIDTWLQLGKVSSK